MCPFLIYPLYTRTVILSLDKPIADCYFEIETTPSCLAEVTEILNQHDTVTQIYRVTGKDKLHVHAVAASAEEMEIFLHTVIDALPGVVSCSCNMILSRIKDIKGLRL